MQIADIWMSQRNLWRAAQIPGMIAALEAGECLPALCLGRAEDDSIHVEDGHHRLMSIWLTGRKELEDYEYILIETERSRPRFGKIVDLAVRCGIKGRQ